MTIARNGLSLAIVVLTMLACGRKEDVLTTRGGPDANETMADGGPAGAGGTGGEAHDAGGATGGGDGSAVGGTGGDMCSARTDNCSAIAFKPCTNVGACCAGTSTSCVCSSEGIFRCAARACECTASGGATCVPWNLAVAAAGLAMCALRADGHVVCWGDNEGGVLGGHPTNRPLSAPFEVPGVTEAVDLVGGGSLFCAVGLETTRCWGALRVAGTAKRLAPTDDLPAELLTDGVGQVIIGPDTACFMSRLGGLRCWGGRFAQPTTIANRNVGDAVVLGNGDLIINRINDRSWVRIGASGETPVTGIPTVIRQLLAGPRQWGVVDTDGRVLLAPTEGNAPVVQSFLGTNNNSVYLRDTGGCSVRTNGALACWGTDTRLTARYGDAAADKAVTISDVTSPTIVLQRAHPLVALGWNACAVDKAHRIQCWAGMDDYPFAGDDAVSLSFDELTSTKSPSVCAPR